MATALLSAPAGKDDAIRTVARPDCPSCGARGATVYESLRDNFFGATGNWSVSRCRQSGCAMLWLDPAPIEDDIGKAYRKYFTHRDPPEPLPSNSRGFSRTTRDAIKSAYLARWQRNATWPASALGLLAYLDPVRRADTDFPIRYLLREVAGRLLDIGCGRGELVARMSSLGWQAEGIDTDPAAVEAARSKSIRVKCSALHEQKFPERSFDAVVMSHVIEHLHRPLQLLKEVYRILRPGCLLLIATPNAESLGHRLLGSRWPFLDPPRHLQVFTTRALKSLVQAAGFAEIEVCTEIRTAAAMLPLIGYGAIEGRLFAYAENLALHFAGDLGEEIALMATK
jgi:2-polyprenyl-3-methyl-5-hydroxy-6-metoxy-1,4-benzoquinol methylase